MPCSFFFFNDTATTEIYTLSLHDALPISADRLVRFRPDRWCRSGSRRARLRALRRLARSEEHTSELQSPDHLVCRLLLEKKKVQQAAHLEFLHHPDDQPLQSAISPGRTRQ